MSTDPTGISFHSEAASQALKKGLGVEKAQEVVRKNPGVLAIRAGAPRDL